MKAINTMSLTFDSLPVNESLARTAVAGFFTQLNPTVEELCDIRTAVSEAVTNSIVHGYRTFSGKVRLTAKIYPERKISITVKNLGCGIADIARARQPFYTTGEEDERSGMGFTVMESFMDEVTVCSEVGKGTTVRMRKQVLAPGEMALARRA